MQFTPKPCEHCGVEFSPSYRVTRAYWDTARFCCKNCRVAGMRGERRSTFDKEKVSIEHRFWSKVARLGKDECWPWIGATEGYGYGYLAGTRRTPAVKAHRFSYELHHGPIRAGMCVCHRCDNPPCVNPAHLFEGTRSDNNADRVSKGRTADHRGEANPKAKLSFEKASAIRALRNTGMTQQAIADKFGVSQNAISQVLSGLRWNKDI